MGAVSAASGDNIYVNTTGNDDNDGLSWETAKLSIKNATGTVNSNGTINIADGLYTGINNTNIILNKNMTISGQSQANTIISGANIAQIFQIQNGVNITMQNLTITNGNNSGNNGGAIENYGNLTLSNVSFTNNTAWMGGAIYNRGNLTATVCEFIDNTAPELIDWGGGNGAAIYNEYANMALTNCNFINNTACYGGAIFAYRDGNLTISSCQFENNQVQYIAGAIYNSNAILNISDSEFKNNSAGTDGGAITNYGILTISNCEFNNNSASQNGGAISNGVNLTVNDCDFINNTITVGNLVESWCRGGAIYNGDIMTLTACNFINNGIQVGDSGQARGGAIHNGGSPVTLSNCNFINNGIQVGNDSYGYGGAIYNEYDMIITACNFTNNTVQSTDNYSYGGAIYNDWNITITGSNFLNNTANYGGAIYNNVYEYEGWSCILEFNRIYGNIASEGSAIYNTNDIADIENNWWGANNPVFSDLLSGLSNPVNWLYMTINATNTTIINGETSNITVSFNNLFNGTDIIALDPSIGHIPDETPVTFNTDLGSIGCKTIQKFTLNGVAMATLTADETSGMAHVNAVTDAQTVNVNVNINPKSSLYLTITPSKTNPMAGDTVVYTLKVGNKGPDTASDVVMTYVIPEGLEFAGAKVDSGTYTYNAKTRTITWYIGNVVIGDPYMWLSLHISKKGQFIIDPTLRTSTYDSTIKNNIQNLTVNANQNNNNTTQVNAKSTVKMQNTGIPLGYLILAILMVIGGLITKKKELK